MRLPTYRTDRLIIRPLAIEDIPVLLALHQDAEVMMYEPPVTDRDAHSRELRDWITRSWGEGLGFWSVVPLVDPGRFLGWVVLIPLGEHGPGTEIGWRFVRNAWGHGYATEAARRILQRGFEIVGLSDIVAGMHAENERSRRLALRIGLSPAEPRMASSKGGALFRLSREDFTQLRGPPRQNLR